VFVRSFKDSNGDGKGDLKGLIEKLDYLNDGNPETTRDLGVDAIWLMPVFESPSYHGYDVVDFERIESDYGSNEDFDEFLKQAHKRGVKVFVDLMLNHTSNQHPWFLEAVTPGSSKRDWYVWSPTDPGWGQPWNPSQPAWHRKGDAYYYGVFWSGMPDLNFRNPKVREEMTRIAVQWAKKGIDGFRLDAIRHLIETGPGKGQTGSEENHVFLKEFLAQLRKVNPQFALVGEVWSNTADIAPYYGDGDNELQMLFDFSMSGVLVNAAWSGDATNVAEQITDEQNTYPKTAVNAPFLSNHDQLRVATTVNKDRSRLGLAAAMLLTLPGAPFVYYGEEIGLANGPGSEDEFKRTPMLWTEPPNLGFSPVRAWQHTNAIQLVAPVSVQTNDESSLLSRYRALIRARHASPALGLGALTLLDVETSKVLAFLREEGEERVVVAHNLAGKPLTVTVKLKSGPIEPLFADVNVTATPSADGISLSLAALSTGVFRLSKP
jgi:glycosidase